MMMMMVMIKTVCCFFQFCVCLDYNSLITELVDNEHTYVTAA